MSKVVVTGGTGFIGRELVIRLLDQGINVIVPTRRQTCLNQSESLQYIECDLLDPKADFEQIFSGCKLVLNCAGEIHKTDIMNDLHVQATKRMLNAFLTQLKSCGATGHWVQLSSVGAYGPALPPNAKRIVSEYTPHAPLGEYEVSKALADELLMEFVKKNSESLTYSILRPSNVCGKNMPNNALRDWAAVIKKNLFLFIGPKDAISTYVHVSDVVDALIVCAYDRRAANQIFNISNDCLQAELVKAMAVASGSRNPRYRIPEWLARFLARVFGRHRRFPLKESRVDALVSRTHYTSEKLYSVLGIAPKINIPGAVKEIIG